MLLLKTVSRGQRKSRIQKGRVVVASLFSEVSSFISYFPNSMGNREPIDQELFP